MSDGKVYEFEIQKCIKIKIRSSSAEEARMKLVNTPQLYQREMLADCVISDGKELK